MLFYTTMNVYRIYTNTGNHVARGSLLSDKVITKIPTVSTRPTKNIRWDDGENKGKLILTEIFPSVQKHDI